MDPIYKTEEEWNAAVAEYLLKYPYPTGFGRTYAGNGLRCDDPRSGVAAPYTFADYLASLIIE
jgi:hypothetical protein